LETLTSCKCGGKAQHLDGSCRACYMRAWRKARKVAGAPSRSPQCADWFDWEVVRQLKAGNRIGRRPTHAERVYLASWLLARKPDSWSAVEAAELLCMNWDVAAQLVRDVASGAERVIPRDWQGKPL
jgi:hypothetical protein